MKIVVIPDVHLKPWLFDMAEKIIKDGRADNAVCLMDLPDDWNNEWDVPKYKETFDRAIAFAKAFPDSLWCYGNHDVSYPWAKLETGYSPYAEQTVMRKLLELHHTLPDFNQMAFVHRVDKVLFCHGGISENFVKSLKLPDEDVDSVTAAINKTSPKILWDDNSPLWLRPQKKNIPMYGEGEYIQVVGHTPVEKITKERNFISTDTFSTYSNGKQIGESAFVIIDTETGEYMRREVTR